MHRLVANTNLARICPVDTKKHPRYLRSPGSN